MRTSILSNKLWRDMFSWKLEVFGAVLGAEEEPYFVASWWMKKLQVFGDAFEEGKINSLEREALHVAIVQNQHPLLWGQCLYSLDIRASVLIVINYGHVESVTLNYGQCVFLFLLLVLILWIMDIKYMRERTAPLPECMFSWSCWKSSSYLWLGFYYKLT